ncbi:MAG TPA: hypothetical protein RMH99_19125 [Sandaracinaceae bacterium LLY-WYZ-13_1]|nr:hypothetical protein [Sandaracinaceae bacterium LLY-WYZ-13_1]
MLVGLGCGDDGAGGEASSPAGAEGASAASEEPEAVTGEGDEAPAEVSEERAPAAPVAVARGDAPALPDAPEAGCAFAAPTRLLPRPAWVDVAGADGAFWVAGTTAGDDGEEAVLVRVPLDGAAQVSARASLEEAVPADRRRAAPALTIHDGRAILALVDASHRVRVARFEPGPSAALAFATAAEGASLRFSPALAPAGDGWVLAWTDERGTPMRVRAARLDASGARRGEPTDLTPAGGGAAAPAFARGAEPPVLVFVDPRQGMSVAHRVAVTDAGFSGPAVARPVGLVAEPPETAAVRLGATDWLGYTAVGNVATTAVGLVRLEGTSDPVPLVAGTGYGVLHVDATRLGDGAVFAADAPTDSPPDAPRELHVRVVDADGTPLGEATVASGPDRAASRGRVAVASGAVATTFVSTDGTYVALGRCASGEQSAEE